MKEELIKIDKHISDLLIDNECVIVPKMGGFLSYRSPLVNNSFQYSFKPSQTKFSFNELLKYNDGLLANHIVQHENLTYNEALLEIEKFVDEFHQELDSGKKFIIEQVGALYKDAQLNVQIEPFENLNYLNDNKGISGITPQSGLQEEFSRGEKIQPETPVSSISLKWNKQKFILYSKNRIIIIALLLTGSILAYYLYSYFSPPSHLNSAMLHSNTQRKSDQSFDSNESKSKSVILVPHSDVIPVMVDKGIANTVKVKETKKVNTSIETVESAKNKTVFKYFIVAGSFKSFDNANRKLDELKLHGFNNAQLFSDSRHLQLVCFDRFTSLEEAQKKIISIRMHYKEAWIFSR